jgi:DNA-binding HxlR family transcriptional regulator
MIDSAERVGVGSAGQMELEEHSFCPVHNAINILQEKWTMHIIRGLLGGTKGFNELRRITGGVNAATLTQRLEHLERLGLVTKTIHSTMPPRTAYELTEAGVGLQKVVDAVALWANKHLPNAKKPPLE